jgi:hypothetical protein
MWLFGLQREVIAQRHYRDGKNSVDSGAPEQQAVLLPFDEAAKEKSRALHRLHKDRKVKLKHRKTETR